MWPFILKTDTSSGGCLTLVCASHEGTPLADIDWKMLVGQRPGHQEIQALSATSFPFKGPQSIGVLRYALVDSSPQGQHDWLNIITVTLSASDLEKAHDMFLCLWNDMRKVHTLNQPVDEGHGGVALALDGYLVQRRGTPGCLASGRSSLWHKLHAYIHSLRMESTSWQMAACLYASTVSITADYGTESNMSKAPPLRACHLFPWSIADAITDEQTLVAEEAVASSADLLFKSSSVQVPGFPAYYP